MGKADRNRRTSNNSRSFNIHNQNLEWETDNEIKKEKDAGKSAKNRTLYGIRTAKKKSQIVYQENVPDNILMVYIPPKLEEKKNDSSKNSKHNSSSKSNNKKPLSVKQMKKRRVKNKYRNQEDSANGSQ